VKADTSEFILKMAFVLVAVADLGSDAIKVVKVVTAYSI
jgi:hypothetical protein